MRALVIGADGFAGRWLLRHLVESGDDVGAAVGPNYQGAALPADLPPLRVDVRDAGSVRDVVLSSQPDVVYYLAGVSRAGAREDLDRALDVSVHGALNVLAAAAAQDGPVRILHVGSSHMYAAPHDETPIGEDWPIRPATVYGAAKAAAESALISLGIPAGVDVIALRAFNHIGPGQQPGFVVPSLARQVAAIERGEQEPTIRAGNLDARRDFTDVRDVVRAYRLAAVHGAPGDAYNVASGRVVSVRQVLDELLRIQSVTADVEQDPALTRSAEPTVAMAGNAKKLNALTGWESTIPLEVTLRDVIDEVLRQPVA